MARVRSNIAGRQRSSRAAIRAFDTIANVVDAEHSASGTTKDGEFIAMMGIDEMKAIATRRTRLLSEDVTAIERCINRNWPRRIASYQNRCDAEFVVMASNNIDRLIAVAEAAQEFDIQHYDRLDCRTREHALHEALKALEGS